MEGIQKQICELKLNFTIEKYFEIINELNNIRNSKLDLAFSQYRNDYVNLCDDDDMDYKTMCKFKIELAENYDTKCKNINDDYKKLKLEIDRIYYLEKINN